jgi:hypothetical protein
MELIKLYMCALLIISKLFIIAALCSSKAQRSVALHRAAPVLVLMRKGESVLIQAI